MSVKALTSIVVLMAGVLFAGCPGGSSGDPDGDAGVAPDSGPLDGADAGHEDAGDAGGEGDVRPGDGDGLESDCGFESVPHKPWEGEVIQVISPNGATCVKMVREADGMGDGFTWNFELIALTVGRHGDVIVISDPGVLGYEVTHHNWYDVANGVHEGVVYRLETRIDDMDLVVWHYYLTGLEELSQQVLWGPVELFPVNP